MTQLHNPANNFPDLPVLTEVVKEQPGIPVLTDVVGNSPLPAAELQQLLQILSPAIEARLQTELEIYTRALTEKIIKHTLAELRSNPAALQHVLQKIHAQGH